MPEPGPSPQPDPDDELRVYIIVRKDKGYWMSKPKFGVQCGHAISMLYAEVEKVDPERLARYRANHEPKIVLECRDTEHLLDLFEKSVKAGFYSERVVDIGRTEFGQETLTALVVGPVWHKMEAMKSFLKKLRLYKDDHEQRVIDLLRHAPIDEITASACEYLNRGAPCCIRPSHEARTCGYTAWHQEFGAEIQNQMAEWLEAKVKQLRGN